MNVEEIVRLLKQVLFLSLPEDLRSKREVGYRLGDRSERPKWKCCIDIRSVKSREGDNGGLKFE